MIVNINQSNYASQAGDIAGLRVIVLSQNQIAFPEDEGITVSPGYFTSIGLRLVGIAIDWVSDNLEPNRMTITSQNY